MHCIIFLVVFYVFGIQKQCISEYLGVYQPLDDDNRHRRSISSVDTIKHEGKMVNQSIATKEETPSNTDDESDVFNDNHLYYNSTIFKNGQHFFIDLEQGADKVPGSNVTITKHKLLSGSYLSADRIPLKFPFPFYGNLARNVFITTGGFVSIGPIFHTYAHIVHYLAPLMANFNPSLDNSSDILIASGDNIFIVQWKDVLSNNTSDSKQKFNFELIMHKNGTIIFAYREVPIPPSALSIARHNVTVGVADGFIVSYVILKNSKLFFHNFIYAYHKLNLQLDKIATNTAIKLDLLPNCGQLKNCTDCLDKTRSGPFVCRWCKKLQLCSDTFDWNREMWITNGCLYDSLENEDQCPATNPSAHTHFHKNGLPKKSKSNAWIGAVIGVIIMLFLIFALVFLYYAYSHPQSKSGMWLIEHRPSRIKMRNFSAGVQEDQLL